MWSSAWMCSLWRISLIFPSLFEVKKKNNPPTLWFDLSTQCCIRVLYYEMDESQIYYTWIFSSASDLVFLCRTTRWKQKQVWRWQLFTSARPGVQYSVTCDSSRTFSCKSQRRNSLTIDSDSLISLMAPYHSLRWMDVRGCARSNIVTSSPYWLNIQYECIMRHCSPHSSYIRARQNETCCCFTLCFFSVPGYLWGHFVLH